MTVLQKAPFLKPEIMERLMNKELIAANMMPPKSSPKVDIEAFLELHLHVELDEYADLPFDELGVTTFERGKVPFVQINKDLTGAADEGDQTSIVGRWRITLAHEGAHVILHRNAMEDHYQQHNLFDEPEASPAVVEQRCLKRDLGRNKVNPLEYQANYCMAALLMPKDLFLSIVVPMLSVPSIANLPIDDPRILPIVEEVADLFQVSKIAARIRMQTLCVQSHALQSKLSFCDN
jgi:hypothetical protein